MLVIGDRTVQSVVGSWAKMDSLMYPMMITREVMSMKGKEEGMAKNKKSKVEEKNIELIKECIFDCIQKWLADKRRGPFSWVDDGLASYDGIGRDAAYKLHWGWVGAWNESGREKTMHVFLREWATDSNIRAAIEREDFSLMPGTYVPDKVGTFKRLEGE